MGKYHPYQEVSYYSPKKSNPGDKNNTFQPNLSKSKSRDPAKAQFKAISSGIGNMTDRLASTSTVITPFGAAPLEKEPLQPTFNKISSMKSP
jgi:hypothetical protein